MAEKRRAGAVMSDSASAKCESDREFLSQAGVSALLRGALLKLVESRPEDPVGFLAEHFAHLSSEADDGGSEHQAVSRALWHLSLAHHSQRSAFNSNIRVAYELLTQCGRRQRGVGGVRGRLYTETLQCLCSEGGLSGTTAAPLLRRIQCHDFESVPFELFRQGVLTCSVFADYIRKSQCLYAAVASAPDRPAERTLCQAVLATLREALETADGADVARYLEASAKISPAKVAQAMAEAHPGKQQDGPIMDAQEFEDAAAALFIARVRMVT
ncbi:tubulin polyglutamylase complex subunit 1 [Megalobrama amblycephala]|uniref:tubulin polyglutamylase complex subunit 1 n=1 Tax=Megalobrama amblycephala TaxID=75352 RepID=UPI0020140E63|nr:tubulin polyglutamylase complex subunit 1 [Megalobrama amblycephala]